MMFKKYSLFQGANWVPREDNGLHFCKGCRMRGTAKPVSHWLIVGSVSVFFLVGCRTAPLPPVNLHEPGWTVREGQAVWKRDQNTPEIAGEVLLATRPDGCTFVQFTKTPFPMIIAQTTTNHWQ